MIEILIVVALVVWSTIVVFKKVFPKTANSVFMSLANACEAKGWTALAKWLKPVMVAGCGGSCGCATSDTSAEPKSEVQAVKWK